MRSVTEQVEDGLKQLFQHNLRVRIVEDGGREIQHIITGEFALFKFVNGTIELYFAERPKPVIIPFPFGCECKDDVIILNYHLHLLFDASNEFVLAAQLAASSPRRANRFIDNLVIINISPR